MAKIEWVFQDESGTNLNRYIATNVDTGEKIIFDLLRGGNISIVGTPLNASNLNSLITAINENYDEIAALKTNVSTNTTNIQNNATGISKNASDISQIQTKVANQEQAINNNKSIITGINNKIIDLESDVNTNSSNIETLQENFNDVNADISDINNRLENLGFKSGTFSISGGGLSANDLKTYITNNLIRKQGKYCIAYFGIDLSSVSGTTSGIITLSVPNDFFPKTSIGFYGTCTYFDNSLGTLQTKPIWLTMSSNGIITSSLNIMLLKFLQIGWETA